MSDDAASDPTGERGAPQDAPQDAGTAGVAVKQEQAQHYPPLADLPGSANTRLIAGRDANSASTGGVVATGENIGPIHTGTGTQVVGNVGRSVFSGYFRERVYVAEGDINFNNGQDSPRKEYLDQVSLVYSRWDAKFVPSETDAVPDLFIPPDTATAPDLASLMSIPDPVMSVPMGQQRWPKPLTEAVAQWHRVLLLGRPGAGKTSYLENLCWQRWGSERGLLPVLVDVRTYDGTVSFFEFVRAFLRNPPNPESGNSQGYVESEWLAGELDRYLRENRILLLVDHLNRMPVTAAFGPEAFRKELSRFFENYPNVWTVLACRTHDYDGEVERLGFQMLELDPWTERQIIHYLELGGHSILLERARNKDPMLLSLGQIPFLLRLITVLTRRNPDYVEKFLSSEASLIREFVEFLLADAQKKDAENGSFYSIEEAKEALARLAAAITTYPNGGTFVPGEWALEQLTTPAPSVPEPNRLLDFGCSATILDKMLASGTVGFWQQTFASYFASLARPAPPGQDVVSGSDASRTGDVSGSPVPVDGARHRDDELTVLTAANSPDPLGAAEKILASGEPGGAVLAALTLTASGNNI